MNINTVSAECLHGMCSACRYEDCACDCHLIVENCPPEEELEDRYDREPGRGETGMKCRCGCIECDSGRHDTCWYRLWPDNHCSHWQRAAQPVGTAKPESEKESEL